MSSAVGGFTNIKVPSSLKKLGVTKMGRQNQRFLMQIRRQGARSGEQIVVDILFDIKQSVFDTLQAFKKAATRRNLKLSATRIEQIIAGLSTDEYCNKIFAFYEFDIQDKNNKEDKPPEIGEPSESVDDDMTAAEQEEAYAASVSDPDYDTQLQKQPLTLLSVTGAIRKDPQRIRVTGVIDTVSKLYKLLTELSFRCTNRKCVRFDIPERITLDTPIYTLDDTPIAFEGGQEEYTETARCPACRQPRNVFASWTTFENAKVIELKNLPPHGSGSGIVFAGKIKIKINGNDKNKSKSKDRNRIPSAVSVNPTLGLEHLTVFVKGKHTYSVGLGEEVEIVGQLYVLASGLAASRFGNSRSAGGGSRANSGSALPVLYAKHLKYTKRERELTLTQIDIDAIHNFASFPDLVNRLVSMFAPDVYGNEEVKLGLLLAAVRGAPIQTDNWYRRHWINVGMLGDKGTGKTTLMYHALKLVLGSQSVSGQHSTGKELALAFKVPRGKISEIMRVMNYLQTRFQSLEINIKATDGHISEDDYANKILEALSQLGVDLKQS
jgi:hypothetical protein